MISRFELTTAWRYVRSKKDDNFISIVSWFALIGITLGVAALILVMSVMGGFRQELLHKVLGINGHITLSNGSMTIKNHQALEKQLLKFPQVKSVNSFVIKNGLITTEDGHSRGIIVRGVEPKKIKNRQIFKSGISEKHIKNFETGRGVLIGKKLWRNYGINVGERIVITIPKLSKLTGTTTTKTETFKVVGVFEIGMHRYDNGMIFMPLKTSQKFFDINGVNQVEGILKNVDDADKFVEKHKKDFDVLYMEPWARINSSFFNALEVERNTMFIILSVMILIAAFNVITGQIMIVKEHKKSISILRTLGVGRVSIIKIFFIVGSYIGILGTTLGFGLGILIADNLEHIREFLNDNFGIDIFNPEVYHLNTIPIVYDVNEIITILSYSVALSLLAGLYPAIRAGRMTPIEGIRND